MTWSRRREHVKKKYNVIYQITQYSTMKLKKKYLIKKQKKYKSTQVNPLTLRL